MSFGDDDDSFGEEFGQRHPPLSIYIKGILERYPDGQIFKVRGMFVMLSTVTIWYCLMVRVKDN